MDNVNLVAALRRQLWTNGFRPVAVYNADHPCNSPGKQPAGVAWQIGAQQTPPKAVTTPVAPNATNTGIWCGGLQPVDIDIPDAALADEIEQLARDHLGVAPVRWRPGTGKRLMLYRASEGSPKKRAIVSRSIFGDDGKPIKIEVLGHGQHFTAYGGHPDGMDYEWRGPAPDAADIVSLTPVSVSDIEEFLATASAIIGAEPEKEAVPAAKEIAPLSGNINPLGVMLASRESSRGRAIADKALAEDIAALASTTANRNDATNGLAYRLGRMIAAGWVDRTTVESHLEHACAANGLWKDDGPNQCRATIRSGLDNGIKAGAPPLADREAPSGIVINLPVASALPAIVDTEDDDAEPDDAAPIDDALTRVPGVLGEVVDWITACGSTGNRVLALSAALPLMGTLLGRRMATPTRGGGGLDLYVITTMQSGAGKSDGKNAVNRIFEKLGIAEMHLGPSGFRSGAALGNHLCKKPLSLCIMDEIADEFQNILSGKSHMIDLEKTIKGAWGTSFASYTTEESMTRGAQKVFAPHLSIYGLTTRENLFNVVKSKDVTSGFINRFTVIDAGSKTRQEPLASFRDPPRELLRSLSSMYNMGARTDGDLGQVGMIYKTIDGDPSPVIIPWASVDAAQRYADFEAECDLAADEAGPIMGKLYGRTAFMAVKIATIRAAGEFSPVTPDHLEWGAAIARRSADMLMASLKEHMVDPLSYPELFARIKMQFTKPSARGIRHMEDYGPMTLPRQFLWENLKHHTGRNVFDFANALKAMKENGEIGQGSVINRRTHRSTECVSYLGAVRRKRTA